MVVDNIFYQYMLPVISVFLFLYSLLILIRQVKKDKNIFRDTRTSYKILLVLLLIFGGAIRFMAQYFSYHPQYMYSAIAKTIFETGRYGFCTLEFNYCFPTYKPYTVYVSLLGFLYSFLEGASFSLARNLNVVFGTLSIPLAYMVSKKYLNKSSNAIIFTSFFTFLPLHIELSKSMETHVFSIFYMLAFFLFFKEFIDTGDWNIFGGTLLMFLMAALSKPLNTLLIFPLAISFYKKNGFEKFEKAIKNRRVLFPLISGLVFLPIYYYFLFRQGVVFDTGVVFFQDNQLSRLFLSTNFYIVIGLLSLLGLTYFIFKKRYFFLGILALYVTPLIIHTQRKPVRLILPALIIMLFMSSDLIIGLGEKFFEKNLHVFVILTVILMSTVFFNSGFHRQPYNYFNEEDLLDSELQRISENYVIYSDRADLAYSVSTVKVHNLNFEEPDFLDETDVAVLNRGLCDDINPMIEEDLQDFENKDEIVIGDLYSICLFSR